MMRDFLQFVGYVLAPIFTAAVVAAPSPMSLTACEERPMFVPSRVECPCGFVASGPDTDKVAAVYADHECSWPDPPKPWHDSVFDGMWGFLIAFAICATVAALWAPEVFR